MSPVSSTPVVQLLTLHVSSTLSSPDDRHLRYNHHHHCRPLRQLSRRKRHFQATLDSLTIESINNHKNSHASTNTRAAVGTSRGNMFCCSLSPVLHCRPRLCGLITAHARHAVPHRLSKRLVLRYKGRHVSPRHDSHFAFPPRVAHLTGACTRNVTGKRERGRWGIKMLRVGRGERRCWKRLVI
jgi:hypothetical protein